MTFKVQIKSINVFPEAIVYKLDPREDNEKLVHIVYLNEGFKEIKVEDFTHDGTCKTFASYTDVDEYLGFANETLFMSNL